MKAAFSDYLLLWRAALAVRHPRTGAWLRGMALVCALVIGAAVQAKTGSPFDAAVNGLRAAYAILGFGCLMYFVPGILKLTTPANAVLVPRMRRRARQLTTQLWLASTLVSALLALGSLIPAQVVFLGVGLWLIALGLARSGHAAGKWLQFLLPLVVVFHRAIPRELVAHLASPAMLAVAVVLMLALGAYTLDMMFPRGGDRHFRLQQVQKLVNDQMTVGGQVRQARSPRPVLWLYGAVLRRDCARRDAPALLMHLQGPLVHWTQRALILLAMVAIAGIVMALLRTWASPETVEGVANGSWIGLSWGLAIQLFDHERRLMRLSFSRGEQGLVRLAPAMPGSGEAFNRGLGRQLLRAALIEWAGVSAAILAALAITGAPASVLWHQAGICCLTLPLVAATLRDHARRSGSSGWWLVLGLFASVGLSFATASLLHILLDTPLLPAAALFSVVLAVLAVTLRWRRLAAAPHAFPVGRLA